MFYRSLSECYQIWSDQRRYFNFIAHWIQRPMPLFKCPSDKIIMNLSTLMKLIRFNLTECYLDLPRNSIHQSQLMITSGSHQWWVGGDWTVTDNLLDNLKYPRTFQSIWTIIENDRCHCSTGHEIWCLLRKFNLSNIFMKN